MKAYNHNTRGLLYHPNWPVRDKMCIPDSDEAEEEISECAGKEWCTCNDAEAKYQSALEKAIEEAVPFENQNQVSVLIGNNSMMMHWNLEPNTFYEFECKGGAIVTEYVNTNTKVAVLLTEKQMKQLTEGEKKEIEKVFEN